MSQTYRSMRQIYHSMSQMCRAVQIKCIVHCDSKSITSCSVSLNLSFSVSQTHISLCNQKHDIMDTRKRQFLNCIGDPESESLGLSQVE